MLPEDIIIAYDGRVACMAAVRQFSQVMTMLNTLPAHLIYLTTNDNKSLPEEEYIKEYPPTHFANLTFKAHAKEESKGLSECVGQYTHPLLVAGAYSRSWVSLFFKKSFITESIRSHRFPIFIYHGLS